MSQRYDDPESGLTERDREAKESRLAHLEQMGMGREAAREREKVGLPPVLPDDLLPYERELAYRMLRTSGQERPLD